MASASQPRQTQKIPRQFNPQTDFVPCLVSVAILAFSLMAGFDWQAERDMPGHPWLLFLSLLWSTLVALVAIFGRRNVLRGLMLLGIGGCLGSFLMYRHSMVLFMAGHLLAVYLFRGGWWLPSEDELFPASPSLVFQGVLQNIGLTFDKSSRDKPSNSSF